MVLIIVPAFNEEQKIGRVVRGLFEQSYRDVVVIDDGSTDRTAELAAAAGATVIRHEINRGQGAALETGNEYARSAGADVVVHFDGDDQFDPADIRPALDRLEESKADVVVGSRFLDNRSVIPWLKRRIILPVAGWLHNAISGVRLTDVHNGFRVLNRRALDAIWLTEDRMAHNSQLIGQVKKQGLTAVESPVKVVYHEYGQGIGDGLKILWDLLLGLVTPEN